MDKEERCKLRNTVRRFRTAIKHHICTVDEYETCQVKEGCDVRRLCRAYYSAEDTDDEAGQ